MATLTVTQRRSSNGSNQRQLDTLRSLGLRRIGHTVELADSEQTRGMLHAIRHLVEVDGAQQRASAEHPGAAKIAKPNTHPDAPTETTE
jgi:large subunit ribosomal protein L30